MVGSTTRIRRYDVEKMLRLMEEILTVKPCKYPLVVVNWDDVYLTQANNKWVFDQLVDGTFSDLLLL